MRRAFFVALALVLAIVGWGLVCAQDFYVVPVQKGNFAPVPKTGQTTSYTPGDDGDLEKGVAWPIPRFTDNGNGTVTDNLTGLIWTKNANMFGDLALQSGATYPACEACATLNSGEHGLTDGSVEGDWRLPNLNELLSLMHYGFGSPHVPNTQGTGKWAPGDPFIGVREPYWSSTTYSSVSNYAWPVSFGNTKYVYMFKNYSY